MLRRSFGLASQLRIASSLNEILANKLVASIASETATNASNQTNPNDPHVPIGRQFTSIAFDHPLHVASAKPLLSLKDASLASSIAPRRYYGQELRTDLVDLSEAEYHKVADHTLEDLSERIEIFVEDIDIEGDVEYSQGVLTINLGQLGTFVINKQTPNRQIWLSSPLSGPFRYDYSKGVWIYARDGHKLHAKLEGELKRLTGAELDLNPCGTCEKLNACVNGAYCLDK